MKKITINIIDWVERDATPADYRIRYWGGEDGTLDAKCFSLDTAIKADIGYWSTEQTFHQYAAYIPADATGFKFHMADRWFGEDSPNAKCNMVYIFNYDGDKAMYFTE